MPILFGDLPPQNPGKMSPSITHLDVFATAQQILNIIFRYRSALPRNAIDRSDEGAMKSLSLIYLAVKSKRAVRMVLPAFPFKSPNAETKVLGNVPDKAEDLALAHLNGMCAAIKDIYDPGAILVIVSDGLVYNDLLGVPDYVVWKYGKSLRDLTKSRGYSNIEFARLKDLLAVEQVEDELDDMSYAAVASIIRLNLMSRYGSPGWAEGKMESYAKGDENKRVTYCGYLKFLELDLAVSYPIGDGRTKSRFKRGVEKIAKTMLKRGDAFARAVRDRYPNHVRLSIHPSTGEDKISINVLPISDTLTPWHNSVAFKIDGTVLAGHRRMFEAMDNMELVHENGEPSYFREKSDLYNWSEGCVVTEPMYPCGVMIRPANGHNPLPIEQIDAHRVRRLAEQNSPIVLRGFAGTRDHDRFVAKSYELGQPTPWKFGLVLKVKDHGVEDQGLNNVLSSEWMPFHFDGMFKTEKLQREDGSQHLVPRPPNFQFFTAITPSPKNTGYTLFAASRLLFKHLPLSTPLGYLKTLTWSVTTPSFGETTINNMPLISAHPSTGHPCLKYHERWPQEKTRFDPTYVKIENGEQSVCDALECLLHDRRICYWHTWEQGDLLISDNFSTLHTRSSFTGQADRELWRIHFD